jgi:SAM-dependent MidA family methyltransferase
MFLGWQVLSWWVVIRQERIGLEHVGLTPDCWTIERMNLKTRSLPTPLALCIQEAMASMDGSITFDRFMAMALYEPGLGYYSNALPKLGAMPESGSDFVTAPLISPLFGLALSRQVRELLAQSGSHEVLEFGAGTGDLALQLLDELGDLVERYTIVELSGSLRDRQAHKLVKYAHKLRWLSAWPEVIEGVVLGNEVLDAMPVQLLLRKDGQWHERGVRLADPDVGAEVGAAADPTFVWADRPTALRPPTEIEGEHDYLTEIHPQAEAFVASLAQRMLAGRGALALFIDYGFPEHEYYHPERCMGTLMCHRLHRSDDNPLVDVGEKDITAHVNFTGIALAAQDAGLNVSGYTSQGRFLLNLGLADDLQRSSLPERIAAMRLVNEHEMGELFKVLALSTNEVALLGFASGDRSHRL